MAKILIVDDDTQLTRSVAGFFEASNHTCDGVGTGGEALSLLEKYTYDAVILDWVLPDISGVDVCTQYRNGGGQSPIIFLTGKNNLEALEQALEAGGDDYIAKPFSIRELQARLKAILKRASKSYEKELTLNGVTLYPENNKLAANGKIALLRKKEVAILEFLMRHPNVIHKSQQLLDAVWSDEAAPSTNSVRVWLTYLRKKLNEIGAPDFVTTVAGTGYIIHADLADSERHRRAAPSQ